MSALIACDSDDGASTPTESGDPTADAAAPDEGGQAPPPPSTTALGAITSDGRHLRDAQGRAVLLRGVNARVDGVFDVDLGEGRVPLEPIPPMDASDCQQMAAWGLNILRLPMQWSGVEPTRDVFDEAYLQRVDAAIECAEDAGLWVMVDLHQDAYSKEIGEDGAPLWAIEPPPEQLLEGPLDAEELQRRRFSPEVTAAFESFFHPEDAFGLQAEFIEMLTHVASRYADHPAVVGFDLFNEPVADTAVLRTFHENAARAVRQAAPSKLVFFEPTGPRGFLGSEPAVNPPFPVEGSVYAPHLYPFVFVSTEEQLLAVTEPELRDTFDNAVLEAEAWQTPWVVGEFGGPPYSAREDLYLGLMYKLLDEYFVSATLWLWKEDSQGSWGLYDHDEERGWSERPAMVELVSRPYAERVAGQPTTMRSSAQQLAVEFTDGIDAPHRLFVPSRLSIQRVSCDGNEVATPPLSDSGHIEVPCGATAGAHTLLVDFGD